MKNTKFIISLFAAVLIFMACNSDDDSSLIPIRDRAEVDAEDQILLQDYLATHFYNYEEFASNPAGADFEIKIDTIAGVNVGKTPLSQQVTSSVITREDIDYTIYTLKVRQGDGIESPTFADSVLVSYKGLLLDSDEDGEESVFDASTNAVWFDLPGVVGGFMEGVTQFNDASSVTPQGDGTLTYEGSGIGAVFMPSGAGFFANTISGVPLYSPLIFTFQVRAVNVTDHDGDGILSRFEDIDGDRDVRSPDDADNSDEDAISQFDYVDPDDDDDGVNTIDEDPDPNGDGDPSDARDTDQDGIPDYLDPDTAIDPDA